MLHVIVGVPSGLLVAKQILQLGQDILTLVLTFKQRCRMLLLDLLM